MGPKYRWLLVLLVILSAKHAAAEEVGREISWLTLGSPNYKASELPGATDVDYSLPPIELPNQRSETQSLSSATLVEVNDVVLDGVTVFSDSEMQELIAPYEGRTISSNELQALRVSLSRMYADAGYVNSGVVIPDQTVEGGIVSLRAIEGELTEISLVGKQRLSERYVRRKLNRYISNPLNTHDIQHGLQFLQQDDFVSRLDARLVPGERLGESVLLLDVDEPKRAEFSIVADNHRSSSVGDERARVAARLTNLTGLGDRTYLSGSTSEGSDDMSVTFDIPITSWNTKLNTWYSRSDSQIIEDIFDELDIESLTSTWGAEISHPLIDNLQTTFSVSLGMEVKHSETTLMGVPFSFSPGAQEGEVDTTSVLLGLDWTRRQDTSVLAVRSTYRRGIDALDATIFDPETPFEAQLNPTGADGEFDILFLQALYIKQLSSLGMFSGAHPNAQVILRGSAQFSGDPLMSLEKLAIGGANTVRGYSENLLVRDNGVATTLEVQLPFWGYESGPSIRNLVIAPFLDFGSSWDDVDTDFASTDRNTDDKRTIVGLGVGVLWQPILGLRMQVYWGSDVYDNFDDDDPRDVETRDSTIQDDGIHFAIVYSRQF